MHKNLEKTNAAQKKKENKTICYLNLLFLYF